jgi:hypothetical protein
MILKFARRENFFKNDLFFFSNYLKNENIYKSCENLFKQSKYFFSFKNNNKNNNYNNKILSRNYRGKNPIKNSIQKYESKNKEFDNNNKLAIKKDSSLSAKSLFKQKSKNDALDFSYKIQSFHNLQSKYNLNSSLDEVEKKEEGRPDFLKEEKLTEKIKLNIGGYEYSKNKENKNKREKVLTAGKKMVLEKKTKQRPLSLIERRELNKRRIQEEKDKLRNMTKQEKKLLQNNESSVVRYDPNYYLEQRKKVSNEIQEIKRKREEEYSKYFNLEDVPKFNQTERLSKRLARLGVSSRRQVEKMIASGLILVDGNVVKSNVPVNDTNKIQVFSNQEYKTPVPNNSKIWLFYKPVGYVCESKDERVIYCYIYN